MTVHSCVLDLRWGDCDQLGHINNVYYLEYAQEARLRYFHDMKDRGAALGPVVVRRTDITFDRPLFYESLAIEVRSSIQHVGNTSFTMRQQIFDREGVQYASIDVVIVVVDLQANEPKPIPEQIRTILEERLATS